MHSKEPREGRRPSRSELRRELLWLTTLRLVVVTTLLLSALLVQSVTGSFPIELNPIYYLVGLTFLASLVYATLFRFVRVGPGLGLIQLSVDLLIITGFVYYSGGIESPFTFLYIITILTGSILLPPKGGFITASLSSIMYGALVALIWNGVIRDATGTGSFPGGGPVNKVYYNLLVAWLAFFAAAFLATYVSEKLRQTGQRLEEQRADAASMQVFYEDVINSMRNGLLTTDRELRVVALNRAGEVILSRRESELRGRRVGEILDLPQDLPGQVTLAAPEGFRFERTYDSAEKGRRHLGLIATELHDRTGQHQGYTLVFQDITHVKALEREVRRNERLAAVGEMAAGIAHEIRNPLASISGSVQVLRGEMHLTGEQGKLMDIVLSESGRLNRTIEDFLFYARPSPPLRRLVHLRPLVEDTVTLARNSDELGAGQSIAVEVAGGVDPVVEADPNHLKQVFWNLVRNALGAMTSGGALKIRIDAQPGYAVQVVFDDEGPGFGGLDQDLMFEPFHGSTSGGSGLGLAIVYRIVKDHGGQVTLESLAPRGARVTITLPLPSRQPEAERHPVEGVA